MNTPNTFLTRNPRIEWGRAAETVPLSYKSASAKLHTKQNHKFCHKFSISLFSPQSRAYSLALFTFLCVNFSLNFIFNNKYAFYGS